VWRFEKEALLGGNETLGLKKSIREWLVIGKRKKGERRLQGRKRSIHRCGVTEKKSGLGCFKKKKEGRLKAWGLRGRGNCP